ncbi:MAG: hypothetical protein ACREID_04490, partial [Planctomycetota bacterium]
MTLPAGGGAVPAGLDVADALLRSGTLSADDWARARSLAEERGMPVTEAAVALGLLSEDQVNLVAADHAGVAYVFPTADGVDRDLLLRFPLETLRRHGALPLLLEGEEAVVAFGELPGEPALGELKEAAGLEVRPVLASRRRIEQVLERVAGEGVLDAARASALDPSGMTAFYRHLTAAARAEASEIRFEPGDAGVRVRFRVNGVLVEKGTEPL